MPGFASQAGRETEIPDLSAECKVECGNVIGIDKAVVEILGKLHALRRCALQSAVRSILVIIVALESAFQFKPWEYLVRVIEFCLDIVGTYILALLLVEVIIRGQAIIESMVFMKGIPPGTTPMAVTYRKIEIMPVAPFMAVAEFDVPVAHIVTVA